MIKNRLKNTSLRLMNKTTKTVVVFILLSMLLACTSLEKEPEENLVPVETLPVTATNPQDTDVNAPQETEDEDEVFYDMGKWLRFDLKALGVKPRTYDTTADTFELSENMQETIANMCAVYGSWNSGDVAEQEDWKDVFVQRFLLNSWYSPEFIKDKDVITKEEAEYIQYSLTGERLHLAMGDDEVIDRSEASSPFNETYMGSYTVSESDKGYVIDAEIITKVKYLNVDGEVDVKEDISEVSVLLKENPISCFDGYSIESIKNLTEKYSEEDMLEAIYKIYGEPNPPFYCRLTEIDEDGMYIFWYYEEVDNVVEQHTATVDWFTANPYTGRIETFFGEVFYIEDNGMNTYTWENSLQAYSYFVKNYKNFEWDKLYPRMDYELDAFALICLDYEEGFELIASNTDPDKRFDVGMQSYVIVDYENNHYCINEVRDGVASAGGYRGEKFYIMNSGIIYDISSDAPYHAPGASVYEYVNGKLEYKEGGYLEPSPDYEYPDNLENGTWYWNDEEITKEEYEEKVRAYTEHVASEALGKISYLSKDDMLKFLMENGTITR